MSVLVRYACGCIGFRKKNEDDAAETVWVLKGCTDMEPQLLLYRQHSVDAYTYLSDEEEEDIFEEMNTIMQQGTAAARFVAAITGKPLYDIHKRVEELEGRGAHGDSEGGEEP